jgi:GT2 family glycosyltransferase
MVGSKIYVHGTEKTYDKAGHLIYWDGQNRGRGAGEVDEGQYDAPVEILWPDGCAALYRREMIEEVGGFDEDFFAYADDAELGMRGRLMGWKARLAVGAKVHHHRGTTMGKYNLKRIHLIERNRLWLVMKHFPWWLLVLNPAFFALRLGSTLAASMRGEGEAAHFGGVREKLELGWTLVEANFAAWAGFTKMWTKRREFRRKRKLGDRDVMQWLRQYGMTLQELARQRA